MLAMPLTLTKPTNTNGTAEKSGPRFYMLANIGMHSFGEGITDEREPGRNQADYRPQGIGQKQAIQDTLAIITTRHKADDHLQYGKARTDR